MERREIELKIYSILKDVVEEKFSGQILTMDIGKYLDSVRFVTLVVDIEDQFNIELHEEDFEREKMQSIKAIADLIERYINE